ncbi:hypothetical protein ACFWA6_31030 [Streptomyces sp. NPDC060020]|uniref:hypothetical protein n=1 Tax=Streptomyces sp. NPDC060020 TaxID=3347038 RepID=UPI00367C1C5C
MRLTRPLLLAAVALLALCGTTATAQGTPPHLRPPAEPGARQAAETLTYVTGDPVEIPDEIRVLRTAKATCPVGTTPTGGGMIPTGYGFQFALTSSYASGRDWIVTGMNDQALHTGTIQAKVVCSNAPHHQVFGARVTLARDQVAILHQPCPSGEVPTGGGGRGQVQGVVIQSSLQNLNTWEVKYYNDTGGTWTAEPFVICSSAPHHQVPGRPGSVSLYHGTGTSWVGCPAGQQVTGGGGYSENTEFIQTTFENNGWRVTVSNLSPTFQQVTAFAVCTGS